MMFLRLVGKRRGYTETGVVNGRSGQHDRTSKRGGGDRSSRPAQLQARESEQKALSLWIKGATFQQIAAAGFGIATSSGAWRAVRPALTRVPQQEAEQAREAQRALLPK